ncbi:MAG: septum formation initiator family protein [Flavobacteriaceae bacterium]|nr:septum formation initiator family protein [Flavobacteriaceae bacterium]
MTLKQLKNNTYFKIFTNFYIVVIIVFVLWMLFWDENSYLVHREFNQELDKLKSQKKYYLEQIDKDKAIISDLKDLEKLEKFAREKYHMKKANEDIFLIEYDTLK